MRATTVAVEGFRIRHPTLGIGVIGEHVGCFVIPAGRHNKQRIAVIASTGGGWDHVSVSLPDRCPTWEEMDFVKGLYFDPDETVIQYHPAASVFRQVHPYCLHLWRPQNETIPMPPPIMVAP